MTNAQVKGGEEEEEEEHPSTSPTRFRLHPPGGVINAAMLTTT